MAEALPDEKWQAILNAYREQPENHSNAQRAGQCDWRTAKRLWEHGSGGRRPIRDIVAEEAAVRRSVWAEQDEKRQAEVAKIRDEILAERDQTLAQIGEAKRDLDATTAAMERQRAELVALRRDLDARAADVRVAHIDHGMARGDAAREREFLIANSLRQYITSCLAVIGTAMTPDVVMNLGRAIKSGAANGSISPADALKTWKAMVYVAKPLAEASKLTAELERLAAGGPTHITETRITVDPTDMAELDAMSQRASLILEQVRSSRTASAEDAVLEAPEPQKALPEPESVQCPSEGAGCHDGTAPVQGDDVAAQKVQNEGAGGGGAVR